MKHCLRLAVGLTALLGSCSYDYRLTSEHEFTWDTTGLSLLELKTRNGYLSVVGGYVGEVANFDVTRVCYGRDKEDAEKHIGRIRIVDSVIDGRLKVVADMPESSCRKYGAHFGGYVHRGMDLDLETSNAWSEILFIAADVKFRNSNAGIYLEGSRGRAELFNSNGHITVKDHHGPVRAVTSNSEIAVGIVELKPGENVDLESSNGKIELSVPPALSASFEASTSNGTVTVSGFSNVQYEIDKPNHKRGSIGSGGTEIQLTLKTTNADIVLAGN